ncbi:fimbria/pilus periplasmic chaperone [Citrobacter portucalensis]|uniref:fimbria/pilus periplasmic chaperone n=1 Tax=Citrobacter portucalensis TaxID=1639133 RepID=UPI002B4A669D|nr:fimbria/pilus periplasmic chaperone [Citrobacter portucalensis]
MWQSGYRIKLIFGILLCTVSCQEVFAAIALDRTRVIFDGSQKSVTLSVSNQNKQLPYLAQAWVEDDSGNKIQGPLLALPPVQRIEPGKLSQVKIQSLPSVRQLPQDRESIFYFNLREIPPRSNKPNTLQIALQTRIKMFYRPASIMLTQAEMATPWQEKLTLEKIDGKYKINNPTPYFITIVAASRSKKDGVDSSFEPFMIAPKSSYFLKGESIARLGPAPVLTYINDYGGRPKVTFHCSGNQCSVTPEK